MSQVNMLAIDLAKSVDSSTTSTKNSNNDDKQTSLFSDVMAKHQERESGNTSQQSGKVSGEKVNSDNSPREKRDLEAVETDVDKKPLDDSSSVENNGVKQTENNDDETSQTVTQNGEVDYEGRDAILAEKNNTEPPKSTDDVATKLLSFILASDEVSTDHIDAKTKNESKANEGDKIITINAASKDKTDSKVNQFASQLDSTTQKGDGKLSSKDLDNAKLVVKNENDEIKVSQKIINQVKVETSTNEKVGANLSLSATAKSVKEAILAGDSLENGNIETKVEARLKHTALNNVTSSSLTSVNNAVDMINEDVNNEAGIEKTENKDLGLEKLTQESKQSIKLNVDNTENTNISPQKAVQLSAQLSNQAASAVDSISADATNEEVKSVSKNEQSLERVINQATSTSSTSNNHQSNSQQGQQQGEQIYNSSKSEPEQVKVSQQVFAKNEQEIDFSEKITTHVIEKSALQTNINEATSQQILSQQSLNYAEEQAIQSNVAKAAADSMSVQSAKTAFNIQAETISINRRDFADAVKDKVMVMINQKIKQLEIRLDPPELGSMHVKLNLQNEQAAVNFVVQNQQAKEALEQNMDKLKDMLAQTGVDVGDANIEQQNKQTSEDLEASKQHGNSNGLDDRDSSEDEITMSGVNLYKASASGVDYYA